MEYDRVLRFVERTSGLRSGAGRAGGVETVPARPQVPVKERTQRLMVNRRASGGRTPGIDHYRLICVELFDDRTSA